MYKRPTIFVEVVVIIDMEFKQCLLMLGGILCERGGCIKNLSI